MQADSGSASPEPLPPPERGRPAAEFYAHYKTLLESSPICILLAQAGGAILAASHAACRLLGLNQQEILAAGCAGISTTPEFRILEAARECVRAGMFEAEGTILRKDGSEVTVAISAQLITDTTGNPQASIVLTETGEPRRSIDALRQSEALLARAQEVASLGSWSWDIPTGELLWSDQQYRLFGVEPARFQPSYERFLALVHPDDRARVAAAFAKALAGEEFQIEFRVSLPDASTRHIFSQASIDCDTAGRPVRVVGTALDITRRKETEGALRENQALLESFYAAAPAILSILDEEFKYLRVDAVTARHLGLPPDKILGRKLADLSPELARDLRPILQSVLDTGQSQLHGMYETAHQPGRSRWQASLFPLTLPNGKRGVGIVGMDLSGQKEAQRALMESEEKSRRAEAQLRLLFEATHQGVLQLRPDGRIVSMNPAAEHIFGLSAADLQGQSPRSTRLRAIREDGTAFPAGTHPFELAVDNGHEVRGTVMGIYNAAQDEYRWIQVDAVPLFRTQSPKPYAVYEFFDDITSRKRAEDALRENDAQLRLALGAAGVGTFEINPQTGKMLCSEITRNQLGIGKDVEIDTDRFLAALHPEDRERIRQTWLELASPSTTASLEAEFRTIAADDRSQRWIAARARVIAGAGGQQVQIVGATLDISDRKGLEEQLLQDGGQALTPLDVANAEAALRESEERFRDTANSAPVIMWYGDSQKQVSFFNKQAAVFTGLSADQLLGDGWQQVIHPDDRETTCAAYSKSGDRRAAYQIEFRARRTDGEYRYMLGTTQPRYIGGVYAGQLGTVLDITELKRRQDEHLARQKLESLGTLAGGIAHDFNNLLGGILSQTELALAELDEGASAESEMKNIRAVAIRGAEIVRQLMVYAGQEADTTQLVDFSLLVEQTLELLKVVVSKHAVLRTILGSDVPPVRANPATLRQILINLVTNASEAMGERDGTIQVTTARVTVSSDPTSPTGTLPPGEYLQLEVSDTGCGMTPETQAKIFDPFFTTKSHGRGLGLPVVHGIVRRLGGEIFVTSHVRQGTTFRILLPAAVASPGVDLQPPATPITELRPAARGTILLVEDEESLRHAVSKILRRDGITVLEAPDGAAALEMLGNHEITVMLLDVTLPGMASPEVFREAKQLRPDVRVILTSAYGAERVAAMFAGFGPQPFLRKPYRAAEVLKFLAEPER